MRVAIISDIHSNAFALKAVLSDIRESGIDQLIVAGDIFGYYPWSVETYELLIPYMHNSYFIKGNHDQLVLDTLPPEPVPAYWNAAKQNEKQLRSQYPESLNWLHSLKFEQEIHLGEMKLKVVHGSPDDPVNGRFYPDNENEFSWFPCENEALIMGHTHYPLARRTRFRGLLLNPGSVGQPRDGNPMPSWIAFDISNMEIEFRRSQYDNISVMNQLNAMNWDERFIRSLNKLQPGKM